MIRIIVRQNETIILAHIFGMPMRILIVWIKV